MVPARAHRSFAGVEACCGLPGRNCMQRGEPRSVAVWVEFQGATCSSAAAILISSCTQLSSDYGAGCGGATHAAKRRAAAPRQRALDDTPSPENKRRKQAGRSSPRPLPAHRQPQRIKCIFGSAHYNEQQHRTRDGHENNLSGTTSCNRHRLDADVNS